MSLKNKGDFLMHGVVLRNRVFRPRSPNVSRETSPPVRPMFHVKPFSPNGPPANRSLNVSRETFLRKSRCLEPLNLLGSSPVIHLPPPDRSPNIRNRHCREEVRHVQVPEIRPTILLLSRL